MTRDEAIGELSEVFVVLATTTIRGLPTEVEVGPEDGNDRSRLRPDRLPCDRHDPRTRHRPGDFDDFLASIERRDPRFVEVHEGDPEAKLTLMVRVSGEDAARLDELAASVGRSPARSSPSWFATPERSFTAGPPSSCGACAGSSCTCR